jgi:hypothetical protein
MPGVATRTSTRVHGPEFPYRKGATMTQLSDAFELHMPLEDAS